MKDFRLFDISDFVMDEDFIRWTAKKTKADNDFWVSWLKQDKRSEKFSYLTITNSKHLIENVNTSEKAITLRLPDQSTIELAPHSRIAYGNNFDSADTRDVYLSGKAFFKVTKNSLRPFRV